MGLEKWAEDITRDVFLKWKSDYSFWKPGFKVFYSPVRERPHVMIISLNPGGNGENFRSKDVVRFEQGDFSVPSSHEYVKRDYIMAKKIRRFFEGHDRLLEQSVAFTVLFFRSRNFREWRRLSPGKRKDMENFSYETVREIIDRVKPRNILVVGYRTHRILKRHVLGDVDGERWERGKNMRRYISAEWNGVRIFCVPHLSGARGLTNGDVDKSRTLFFKFIK